MSARFFCDVCSEEVPDGGFTSLRLKGSPQATGLNGASMPISIEVIAGVPSGAWNSGHLCEYCLRSAIDYAFEHRMRARAGQ